MRLSFLCLFTIIALLCSCGHSNSFQELHDGGLTVQMMRLPAGGQEGTVGFKVRLIPSAGMRQLINRQDMWYNTDSCFYLVNGAIKINASMVQPIANGADNSLEFLVVFDQQSITGNAPVHFVYYDHFFNHKIYNFHPFKI